MLDTEKLKVLIPQQILSEGINYLTTLGYEVTHGSGFDELAIIDSIKDCSAILIRNAQITKKVIDAAPKLRVIARHGVGVDNIDVAYATERGIWVTNAPESNYNAVAEHTIMVLLALAKNLLINSEAFAKGDFNVRHRIINNEVKGKVLGVVGYGRVGKEVSKKAFYGLDMEVLVFDPFVKKEELPNFVNHSETLEHLFATSDYITLHLPSNPLTKEIINYNYLKLMKKSAYLINAARAEIVSENDLIEILSNNLIAGAALDVFKEDPPDYNSPLFKLSNIILLRTTQHTPHEAFLKMALDAGQGIYEVFEGKGRHGQ